ncbi:unnamed protein product [Adineta steineri]|uniref:Prolyl 4-hydroxylase alpha subunit domain-containing protein n=1 Tax=Adineta steineri TaxID=433720 RepID=A0A814FD49_9BILA|nr:unnamed protein product [Adineta steineri]
MIDYLTNIQQKLVLSKQFNVSKDNLRREKFENNYNLSEYESKCPYHQYKIRLIERKPLIIYIEQFLTQNEIKHLIQLADSLLKRSMIHDDKGGHSYDQYRTSTSAGLKRHQTPIVKCIEQRFAQFQGGIHLDRIEPLQIVKYTHDQQFKSHYDWFPQLDLLKSGGQRISTFFSYLQSNCSLGETEFLDIQFNEKLHKRFCDILICDEKSIYSGIRFRPIPGNTIFWFNIDEQGQVEYLTYHAGRPPSQNGHKIGLNTWIRQNRFSI